MERFVTSLGLYAAALALIYTGAFMMDGAPWPHTTVEFNGACLMVMGMIAKLAGHVVVLGACKAR